MDDSVFEAASEEMESVDGHGKRFGSSVYEFAEGYMCGEDVTTSNVDERHVK